jgi:sugar lactone lactonase YvrE
MKYFQALPRKTRNILRITGHDTVIVDFGRANITLPNGTHVTTDDALLYPNSTCTLLNFRDIQKSSLHVRAHEYNNEEFLLITKSS